MTIGRLSVLAWTIAWGMMGVALYISGVFNSPRTGPLWVALAGGAIPWSIAGAFTFPDSVQDASKRWHVSGFLSWALAYLLSFALAGFPGRALNDTIGGFVFLILGWAVGPGAGAFVSTWRLTDDSKLGRSCIVAAFWILGFFAGTYVGFVGVYIGPELAKVLIGSLIGMNAAPILGFGVGSAAGGLVASAIAVTLTRAISRFPRAIPAKLKKGRLQK